VLPGGDNTSVAYRVNNYGQVVGWTGRYVDGQLETQPFLWTPIAPNNIAGSMIGLGNFGGTVYGLGSDINDMGQVSGYAPDGAGDRQAFLWSPSGGSNTPIGAKVKIGMVGLSSTLSTGINNQGQVGGSVGSAPSLWTPNVPNGSTGTVTTLPYTGYGSVIDLNNNGQMTGHMNGYDGTYQAVRWTKAGSGYAYRNIGDDGGSYYYSPSAGAALNDSGLVVGGSIDRVFMWDASGAITDILPSNLPNNVTNVGAMGVDNAGNVVGAFAIGSRLHAFLYTGGTTFDGRQFYDLEDYIDPDLGWLALLGAGGMNRFGQICGYGYIKGELPGYYELHAFLLTPIWSNREPDCSNAVASVDVIWPPNHKFESINVVGVIDPDGDPVTITIDGIFQDEPVDTFGDGNHVPDGMGVGTNTAQVRAERSGTNKAPGDGRVYHIFYTADDGKGGRCSGEVRVCVPHDQGQGSNCVDGGPLYDSTISQ
jgi:probable HAF family extracellular repeat protein